MNEKEVCECGHDWNFHNVLTGEVCHERDCNCKGYKLKGKKE